MPRVNERIARKDYPQHGIKKGEKYYWWKFRYGSKVMSKTYPKPSQLTQSDFLQRIYDINERLGNIEGESAEDIENQVQEIIDELRELADECSDKQSNMPDSLQNSPTGQLLEDRSSNVNEMADELENIDYSEADEVTKADLRPEDIEGKTELEIIELLRKKQEEANTERLEELQSEVSGISYSGE